MKLTCPRCNSKLEAKAVGEVVSCPSCSVKINVEEYEPDYVIITDIRMEFMSMVIFMVKLSFAAIPASIIVGFVFGIIYVVIKKL